MFSELHNIFDAFTKRERRIWLGALVVFLLSAFVTTINAFYAETTVAPVAGGHYREGIVGQPTFLNPLIAQSDIDRAINGLLYRNLLDLSESHKVSDDHREWSFALPPDLFWSDGEPVTANDVLFTIEALQDPETRSPLAPAWQGISVERMSEREVRFTLKTPYAFFEDTVRDLRIVPQHIFGTIPLSNIRLSDYNLEPVGSGPYIFDRFSKRKDGFIDQYVLTANPRYSADGPLINKFTVLFFKTYDEATAAFNRRDIDGLGGLEYQHLDALKIVHEVAAFKMPRYYALFLNENAHPALKDVHVREALRSASNREGIIDTVLQDHGTTVSGPLHPDMKEYDAAIYADEAFSLLNTRTTLEASGWDAGEDGILSKTAKGETTLLSFSVIVPDIPFLVATAEYLARDWKTAGIELKPIVMSPEEIAREIIKTRNYEIILFGNILRNNPDVFSFWHSSERFAPGLNLALYDSRDADALLEAIRRDFDPESMRERTTKLQELIHEDVPAIFLFSPHYLYAHPKNLGGLTAGLLATPADRFADVAEWHLKTARVFR